MNYLIKELAKRIFPFIPRWLKKLLYGRYERRYEGIEQYTPDNKAHSKKRLLFYHKSGLSFGGTEKFLQILAKHLNKKKYDVYFMYAPKLGEGRKRYLDQSLINFIPFSYQGVSLEYPFYLKEMKPTLTEVLIQNNIDQIITAGSGYSEYPINTTDKIPIIMINIFGSPSTKKNIVKQISISNEVQNKILSIVQKEKCEVMYIPSEKPPGDSESNGQKLRLTLGLHQGHMIFGRIGRADDTIFDPIGIKAFQKVVKKYPQTHYLIMSPPPIVLKMVKENDIPNMHFLDSTSEEEMIWGFHFAIDALAHFRNDGESCGLNIIESMIAGKPIITHRSHIWNAHLEYLDDSFARVAEKDNVEQYASYMEEFILLKENNKLGEMGLKAKNKSKMFLIENNIKRFEGWIDESIVE